MDDPFDLQRFINAQDGHYEKALGELQAGRKRSHWMWFIFPQIAGLGASAMAQHYAIAAPAEARAYIQHPLLGERLIECTEAVNAHAQQTVSEIFGSPDDLKFRSSMTLFALIAPAEPAFATALQTFFNGVPDPLTIEKLQASD